MKNLAIVAALAIGILCGSLATVAIIHQTNEPSEREQLQQRLINRQLYESKLREIDEADREGDLRLKLELIREEEALLDQINRTGGM